MQVFRRKMKVILIDPPFERLMGIYNPFFPLGLGYLAAVCKAGGVDVQIYRADIPSRGEKIKQEKNITSLQLHHNYRQALEDENNFVWDEIRGRIMSFRPDLVGIQVMTPKLGSAKMVSRITKRISKDILVVWGGPHPTLDPAGCLSDENVDILVRQEGEETIKQLILCFQRGAGREGINGISFRENGSIRHNPPQPLISDLDSIPFPSRESLLKKELFYPEDFGDILISRGCPFCCAFCSSSGLWTRKVRRRSVENIIAEIRSIKKEFKTRIYKFHDDSFTLDRGLTISLCRAIIKEKLDIGWFCDTRLDLIDSELLSLMKKAGCLGINVGIESGSEKILKYISKGIGINAIKRGVALLNKSRLDWHAYFMIGFPPETEADLKETVKLIKEIRPPAIVLSIFTPYPETDIFRELTENRAISTDIDWSKYSHHSPENAFIFGMDKDRFRAYVEEIACLVDRINHSPLSMVRKAMNRSDFYYRHPGALIKTAFTYLKRMRD